MNPVTLLGHEIDRCKNCKGIFLDKRELVLTKNGDVDGFEATETIGKKESDIRKCPSCSQKMNKRIFNASSEITIDGCPNCHGIFLDYGELLAIDNFLERDEKTPVPHEILRKVKEEAEEIKIRFKRKEEQEREDSYKFIDEIPTLSMVTQFFTR